LVHRDLRLVVPQWLRSSEGGFAPLPNLPPKEAAAAKPALGTERQSLTADLEGHSLLRQTPTRLAPATPARCSQAAPRAAPSEAASRTGAPPVRDDATVPPECRSSSTSSPAPLTGIPSARP